MSDYHKILNDSSSSSEGEEATSMTGYDISASIFDYHDKKSDVDELHSEII